MAFNGPLVLPTVTTLPVFSWTQAACRKRHCDLLLGEGCTCLREPWGPTCPLLSSTPTWELQPLGTLRHIRKRKDPVLTCTTSQCTLKHVTEPITKACSKVALLLYWGKMGHGHQLGDL